MAKWKKHDRDKLKVEYITGDEPVIEKFLKVAIGGWKGRNWNWELQTKGRRDDRQFYWEESLKKPKFDSETLKRYRTMFDKIINVMDDYADALVKTLKYRMAERVDEKGKPLPPLVSVWELQAIIDVVSPILSIENKNDDDSKVKFDFVEKLKVVYEKQKRVRKVLAERWRPPLNT